MPLLKNKKRYEPLRIRFYFSKFQKQEEMLRKIHKYVIPHLKTTMTSNFMLSLSIHIQRIFLKLQKNKNRYPTGLEVLRVLRVSIIKKITFDSTFSS